MEHQLERLGTFLIMQYNIKIKQAKYVLYSIVLNLKEVNKQRVTAWSRPNKSDC